jgi:hypothetical protein
MPARTSPRSSRGPRTERLPSSRDGQAVAAVVPIQDFNALEDAIDRYLAREADRDLAENPDAPTYNMSEVVAAIFEEEPGKGAA